MRTEVLAKRALDCDATQLAGQLPGWTVWQSLHGRMGLPLSAHCTTWATLRGVFSILMSSHRHGIWHVIRGLSLIT